ncbi:MAG: hypothetical protein UX64_C0012G0006 [Microgenomates group bacterium GW2011_GWC2_46_7]|nr:MAG: hypothetical protein UX64_C0012G0006 [Microgenomates group bacterium GW2011_GWC2_46_7]
MVYIWVMPTSNWKGQLAVSKAEIRAIELGYTPSRPLMDGRYDMIVDDGKKLWRVQVKYANGKPANTDGSVAVKLAYETRRRRHVYTYRAEEVDALVVYIPRLDRVCWFPCEVFTGKKVLCVRITPSLNGQTKKIYHAHDYFW